MMVSKGSIRYNLVLCLKYLYQFYLKVIISYDSFITIIIIIERYKVEA